ncbi:MAG TPA: DUF4167 domain-containing protein [Hyphomicrobiaceae bacterium]|nr:DUF4167 domain-containing protein [Hyphomicrobiaceae bacterium]
MRQGQQNRRGRGRNNNNNNNRKTQQNPLTRSFESNGPDIKIRGTPSHIAEKYVSLARDALSFGDPVLAENYLQHAEHYNRIIMTYREQQVQQSEQQGGSQGRHREAQDNQSGDDDQDGYGDDGDQGQADAVPRGQEPQPLLAEGDGQSERQQPRNDRGGRNDRNGNGGGDRPDPRRRRGPHRPQRDAQSGGQAPGNGGPKDGERDAADEKAAPLSARAERKPPARPRDNFEQEDDQPEFLRRPIRKPRRAVEASSDDDADQGGKEDKKVVDNPTA